MSGYYIYYTVPYLDNPQFVLVIATSPQEAKDKFLDYDEEAVIQGVYIKVL